MNKTEKIDELDNGTRHFIDDAISRELKNVPLDLNPAFQAFSTRLVEGAPGSIVVAFKVGQETLQGHGSVSGGALASMLDIAMAVAVLSKLKKGQTCATINLNVNMMKGSNGTEFSSRSTVDRIGGKVAFAQAQLFDVKGNQVAGATSAFAVIS